MNVDAALSVRHLSFSFGRRPVVCDVSFDVHAGETFCLLGRNGCGKTTLLRCITGALAVDSGSVHYDGRDARTLKPLARARHLAVVPQGQEGAPEFSALDFVRMGRAPHLRFFEMPGVHDTDVATASLRRVGVEHLGDHRFNALSGGERQLVSIARALCQEPRLMLLDEPTSHLDYPNGIMLLELLGRLAADGLAIVMTTHDPDQPLLMRSNVGLMRDGSFVDVGSAAERITTETLRQVYGIEIAVIDVVLPGREQPVRVCIPHADLSRP